MQITISANTIITAAAVLSAVIAIGGDDVVLTVNVGDMLVICVASQKDYFNVEGGSGYKELGSFPTARRMYVYWIRVEEAGDLMLA